MLCHASKDSHLINIDKRIGDAFSDVFETCLTRSHAQIFIGVFSAAFANGQLAHSAPQIYRCRYGLRIQNVRTVSVHDYVTRAFDVISTTTKNLTTSKTVFIVDEYTSKTSFTKFPV